MPGAGLASVARKKPGSDRCRRFRSGSPTGSCRHPGTPTQPRDFEIDIMSGSILRKALPSTVREIRVLFSPAQAPQIKSFIQSSYQSIKASNPDLPLLFRESSVGTPARAIIRFEHGVEKQVSLDQAKSSQDIESSLARLIQKS
ncbi:hypothetical protein O181_083217 [Austropuccinia psidii MF-1]|uniref:Ribosomal protein/NADH dehydrogenase domain-containing protein n=1 Tax=Austropuccinia psidii MF-1 TaxID=1389203 RepID=A0A9Q3FRX9_9BASI|nr:hypothetical protein [Austropuccinia psidii MF-1]